MLCLIVLALLFLFVSFHNPLGAGILFVLLIVIYFSYIYMKTKLTGGHMFASVGQRSQMESALTTAMSLGIYFQNQDRDIEHKNDAQDEQVLNDLKQIRKDIMDLIEHRTEDYDSR